MKNTWTKAISLVAVGGMLAVLGASSATADTDQAVEITGTDAENAISSFLDRLASSTSNTEAGSARDVTASLGADYQVFTNVPGDAPEAVWIIPAGSDLPIISVNEDGSILADLGVDAPNSTANTDEIESGLGGITIMGHPSGSTYTWQSANCYARVHGPFAHADACSRWGKVTNDGNSTKDYWAYTAWSTCYSASAMKNCWLTSVKSSSSTALTVVDWVPKSDTNGGCRNIGLGLSIFGFGANASFDTCESHKIIKGSAAGTFESRWTSGLLPKSGSRATQFMLGFEVPQNGNPGLGLTVGVG